MLPNRQAEGEIELALSVFPPQVLNDLLKDPQRMVVPKLSLTLGTLYVVDEMEINMHMNERPTITFRFNARNVELTT